mmetsp:Transcript_12935/g.33276  ORF Transcript_12935/g.33276 Transcript_12935/m.33276 type:complete len:132 (+) Transcript_12935:1-396(+)
MKAMKAKAMKTAMKAMKAKAMKAKAMKVMKAMKVKSKIAKGKMMRAMVMNGSYEKTSSGLKKSNLIKSKSGKIVSKASSAAGKKAYKRISGWTNACKAAKKALGLSGFVPCGGKSAQGKAFYAKAKAIYNA